MSGQIQLLEQERLLLTRLLAIIAHDVKSPIDCNLMLLDLFKEDGASKEDYVKFFSGLERQFRSSKNILEDLLSWAKLLLGNEKGQAEHRRVRIRNLTGEIIESVQYFNIGKNIAFTNDIPDDLFMKIHVSLYRFVLRNLLMNSIKFSHKNGKTHINAEIDSETLMVLVTDLGTAVKPEKLASILNFTNSSERGTHNESGSGIGLMLCNDCLRYFGGELGAKSINNRDTAFFFKIPVKE